MSMDDAVRISAMEWEQRMAHPLRGTASRAMYSLQVTRHQSLPSYLLQWPDVLISAPVFSILEASAICCASHPSGSRAIAADHSVTAAPFRLAANQKTFGTMRPPNGVITDLMVMNQPFIG